MEFHRRNSCGRRPGFRRRPRKPSTAKPGWRSISTLYLTAIFIGAVGVVSPRARKEHPSFQPFFPPSSSVNSARGSSHFTCRIAGASSKSRGCDGKKKPSPREIRDQLSIFTKAPAASVFATNYGRDYCRREASGARRKQLAQTLPRRVHNERFPFESGSHR